VSLNGNKLEDVADPVHQQDAVTLAYLETNYYDKTAADGNYYLDTTPLNSITAPTGDLSLNSQKITNLANATAGTDALNQDSADARYYLNTTTLNDIVLPTASVSLNSFKLTSVANGTVAQDAMTLGQDLRYQWSHVTLSADITSSINSPHKVVFDSVTEPSLANVTRTINWDTDGIVIDAGRTCLVTVQAEI
jgi:hypothetical protein